MTAVDLFFFGMFSTISTFSIFPKKVIGPDASENVLGRPGGFGELLGASGGGPGGLLKGPGALRETPGGVLGGSWDVLAALWRGVSMCMRQRVHVHGCA